MRALIALLALSGCAATSDASSFWWLPSPAPVSVSLRLVPLRQHPSPDLALLFAPARPAR